MTSSSLPRRSLTSRACAWGLALATLAPPAALAGKKEDAKAHIARATRAHKDARYEEARVELAAAYALDPRPDLLYAIAQVDAKLGNCDEATAYYQRFAATQRDPQIARVVEQAIAACTPAPEPAEPATDGAPAEPAAVEDPPPDPPAAQEPPAPVPPRPATPRAQPSAPSQPAPATASSAAPDRSPWYHDNIGHALVGGGLAATVIGLVAYGSALSEIDAAGDRASTTTLDRFRERLDRARSQRTVSIVFTGAGAALIGAGIVHYVLHARTVETRGFGVAPARGGVVVSYGGSF